MIGCSNCRYCTEISLSEDVIFSDDNTVKKYLCKKHDRIKSKEDLCSEWEHKNKIIRWLWNNILEKVK